MRSKIYDVDDCEFSKIVKNSQTFTEILRKCGLTSIGSNISTVKRRMLASNIDFSHIPQGRRASAGRRNYKQPEISNELLFTANSKFSRKIVRRRILRDKLIDYHCDQCDLVDEWHGKKLILRLDHKNGDRTDHRIENLRWLCPNCDSQQETFGSKNRLYSYGINDAEKLCCSVCGSEITRYSKSGKCHRCSSNAKIPDKEDLIRLISNTPMTQIGKMYGVSDKAVAKWCKKYGINKPVPGYWSKVMK